MNKTFRQAGENAVAIIQSADDECADAPVGRHIYALLGDVVVGRTAAGERTDMLLECQLSIHQHAEVDRLMM